MTIRALPAAVALAATCFVVACDINIGLPGDADCADLAEVCPNLTCPAGFATGDDGCPLCECADPGPTVCWSDDDCAGGRTCDSVNFCEPPPGCAEGGPCPDVCYGLCVIPRDACASDADCEDGSFCNFTNATRAPEPEPDAPSGGGADGDDGADGDGSGAEAPPEEPATDPPPAVVGEGVCTPFGCSDVVLPACPPGTTPVVDFATDACGDPKCVPVDACRSLDPQACEVAAGCRVEALQCPCDAATGACPDCAELVCVPDDAGCEGLDAQSCAANPDCEGFFVDDTCTPSCDADGVCAPCSQAPADFICLPRTSDGTCASDADCLADERCALRQDCATFCGDDGQGGAICTDACWTQGTCEPAERTCWDLSPEECEGDPACELGDGAAAPPAEDCACDPNVSSCACGGDAAPPPEPAPICQPRAQTTCAFDEDCGAGRHCEVESYCPDCVNAEPACLAPCWLEGRCVDGPRPPPACADGTQCPDGTVCEEVTVCTDCAQPSSDGGAAPPSCTGTCDATTVCVPIEPPTLCADDTACAEGERCDLDVCGTQAEAGAERPAQCLGVCAPVPPQLCYSDYDCTDDSFCDFSQGCFQGGTNMLVAQCGTCAPLPPPPPPPPPADGTFCNVPEDCAQLSPGAVCRDPNQAIAAEGDAGTTPGLCLANPDQPDVDQCWGYCVDACGDALTPARDPNDADAACVTFVDTCIPPGWTTCDVTTAAP